MVNLRHLVLAILLQSISAQTWCFTTSPQYTFPWGTSEYEIQWWVDPVLSKKLDPIGNNQALALHKYDVKNVMGRVLEVPTARTVAYLYGTYILGQRLVNVLVNQLGANGYVAISWHFNPYTNKYFKAMIYDTPIAFCAPPTSANNTLKFNSVTCGAGFNNAYTWYNDLAISNQIPSKGFFGQAATIETIGASRNPTINAFDTTLGIRYYNFGNNLGAQGEVINLGNNALPSNIGATGWSFTFWINIRTKVNGQRAVVFTNTLSEAAPQDMIRIYSQNVPLSDSWIFDVYHNGVTASITLPNVPLQSWLHWEIVASTNPTGCPILSGIQTVNYVWYQYTAAGSESFLTGCLPPARQISRSWNYMARSDFPELTSALYLGEIRAFTYPISTSDRVFSRGLSSATSVSIPTPSIWYKMNALPDPQVMDAVTEYPHHGWQYGDLTKVGYASIGSALAANVVNMLSFNTGGYVIMPSLLPTRSFTLTMWVRRTANTPHVVFECGNGLTAEGRNAVDSSFSILFTGSGETYHLRSYDQVLPYKTPVFAEVQTPNQALNTWFFWAIVGREATNKLDTIDFTWYSGTTSSAASILASKTGFYNPNVIRARCTLGASINGLTPAPMDVADFRLFSSALTEPQIGVVKGGF